MSNWVDDLDTRALVVRTANAISDLPDGGVATIVDDTRQFFDSVTSHLERLGRVIRLGDEAVYARRVRRVVVNWRAPGWFERLWPGARRHITPTLTGLQIRL